VRRRRGGGSRPDLLPALAALRAHEQPRAPETAGNPGVHPRTRDDGPRYISDPFAERLAQRLAECLPERLPERRPIDFGDGFGVAIPLSV